VVLLVSYDLNGRERPSSYSAVRQVIEPNAIDYRRPLYSQWFVETNGFVGGLGRRLEVGDR
jgi:hypothetical protein